MRTSDHPVDDRNRRRGTALLAVVLGALLSSVMVLTASRAAFSDTTTNEGNLISAGDVVLDDDDSGSALFEIANMAPGDSETACIEVTYSGTITDPGEVVLYSGGYDDSGSLGEELALTIEAGVGGGFASCAGFVFSTSIFDGSLSDFDGDHTDYGSGTGDWDPTSTPESMTYRFTVELPSDADSGVQGESVTDLVFTWEVQS